MALLSQTAASPGLVITNSSMTRPCCHYQQHHQQRWATEAMKRCDEALNASSLYCFNFCHY
jgi:hypothetical protein